MHGRHCRLRLAWNFTAWNVIGRKTKAARINAARQFACLQYKLKLVDVLRALKGQVAESTRQRRADAREKRNTRLVFLSACVRERVCVRVCVCVCVRVFVHISESTLLDAEMNVCVCAREFLCCVCVCVCHW